MRDGGRLYSIGDLARRTGLAVRTIRFYSDGGIVAPAGRSPAGHRLYDAGAIARLDLVRTLRELDVDLPTIRKVLDRELSLPAVAAAHAEALDVQIRILRLRRAVLRAAASHGSTPEEMDLMHKLARLSQDERQRLIGDFLDAVFGRQDAEPCIRGDQALDDPRTARRPRGRAGPGVGRAGRTVARPGLPRQHARGWPGTRRPSAAQGSPPVLRRGLVAMVRDQASSALVARIEPDSPQASPVVAALTAHYAQIRVPPRRRRRSGVNCSRGLRP